MQAWILQLSYVQKYERVSKIYATYYFSYNQHLECRCLDDRAVSKNCDQITGKCECKKEYSGDNCEDCADTYFEDGTSCKSEYQQVSSCKIR